MVAKIVLVDEESVLVARSSLWIGYKNTPNNCMLRHGVSCRRSRTLDRMKMTDKSKDWLQIGTGDRILLGVFAPLVTLLLGGFTWGCHLWQTDDRLMTILRYILMEVFSTATLFGALVATWAIAKPKWAGRLLQDRLLKTLLCLIGLGPIMVVFALLASRQ